jgi:hypothetical protein
MEKNLVKLKKGFTTYHPFKFSSVRDIKRKPGEMLVNSEKFEQYQAKSVILPK